MMRKAGRRRGFKSWFVEPYKQVKLGLIVLLLNLVFAMLIFGVFGYYVLDIYRTVSIYFQLSQAQSLDTFYKLIIPVVVGSVLIILFVITTLLLSVRYTHEIYGPLVSIHRFLDELLTGRKPIPIHLRESDQLKELAEKLNQLAERITNDPRSGAMIKIHTFLDDLLEGKRPEALQLRESDNIQELVVKINRVSELLKNK